MGVLARGENGVDEDLSDTHGDVAGAVGIGVLVVGTGGSYGGTGGVGGAAEFISDPGGSEGLDLFILLLSPD